MTTDSEKEGRETVKEYFNRKIASTKEIVNEYKLKSQTVESRNESTAMKAFYASIHISCIQHVETLEILGALVNSLFDFSSDLRARISNLDKTIRNIAEKTGVNISDAKKDIKDLQETIGPNIKAVIQVFANLQKEEERRKKNGDVMIV